MEGDISISKEWIEYHVKKCDVVLPLVAIATPKVYVTDPLRVFELDFEENLRIIRQCVKYKKRVVFPSTSEVYGMCPDTEFDEEIVPESYMGDVIGNLNSRRGNLGMSQRGDAQVIDADIPLATMFGYVTDLRSMTQGRGTSTMQFANYSPVPPAVQEALVAKVKG